MAAVNIVSITVYLVLSAFITAGVLYYFTKKRKATPFVYTVLFFSYWINFASVALLSLDLSMAMYEEKHSGEYDPKTYLKVIWQIVYWSIQVFAWVIIPFAQSYAVTGEFTILRKIRGSLLENAIIYIIYGVVGAIGLAVLLIVFSGKIKIKALPTIVTSASNTFGLSVLLFFLGYGLVELPRIMWNKANRERSLTHLEFRACNLNDRMFEADDELGKYMSRVHAADRAVFEGRERKGVDFMLDTISSIPDEQLCRDKNEEIDPNYSNLVSLNRKVKSAISEYSLVHYQWEVNENAAFWLEDVIDCRNNPNKLIESDIRSIRFKSSALYILNKIEWFWACKAYPWAMRVLTFVLASLSVLAVWCEAIMSINNQDFMENSKVDNLSPLSVVAHALAGRRVLLQLFTILTLAYISLCAYFAMFRIKFFNFYRLVPHHSDPYSLLFSALFMSRIMAPLCYNYTKMVVKNDSTAFSEVLGNLDAAADVYIYLPIALIFLCLGTLFNLYSRFVKLLGVKRFAFEDEMIEDDINEGRDILQRERTRLANKLNRKESIIESVGSDDVVSSRMAPNSGTDDSEHELNPFGDSNDRSWRRGPKFSQLFGKKNKYSEDDL
eukprot:gb/GECH01013251.1/.p1 GENE.gb/GECH01013251.1/~~gb/GECH01013251.1/.p1  ORF type:complete len:610 (+),score=113.56 gb/GECH01013251.1/:1-1830(+)